MNQKITQTLLCDITQQISLGRPIWALARANEYLEANNPLRAALARKALSRSTCGINSKVGQEIIVHGKKFGELTKSEQEEIIKIEPAYSTSQLKIIIKNRLGRKDSRKISAEGRRRIIKPRYAFA